MEERIQSLFALLEGAREMGYIGESVSQLTHGLQAAQAARLARADEHCILAALFHDVGHLLAGHAQMGDYGVAEHETLGAEYLADLGFSEKVCALVAGHVNAKRYLVARDERYRNKLSPASQQTLKHQGGAMSEEEARAFEAGPYFKDILRIRAWDEMAKDIQWVVPDLEEYRALVQAHLEAQAAVC